MKILHYFLGFPPYRSGGLTRYAVDLMKSQASEENEVLGLWPGTIESYSGNPRIVEKKKNSGIRNLELINPLPVPLDEGIRDVYAFIKKCDISIFVGFLKREEPDVIHIHTLMGLYKEFIMAASQLKVRTVFTTHDYFGLCPKVTLYRFGKCCDDDNECKRCIQCNSLALSLKKIQLMQSPLYRWGKNTALVKKLRKKHRAEFFGEQYPPEFEGTDLEEQEYAKMYCILRAYYISMYENIDFIHFNSTVAEKIYKRYVTPKDSKVISITHSGIRQHERKKVYNKKRVILCLAPAKPFKGWNILKEACDRLWKMGENIELRVYSPVPEAAPYMVVEEDGFNQDELDFIMRGADVLVAPSIWYETFGFTVLEALSYGVPVIVSHHVGAKDIIGNCGIVVEAGSVDELEEAIMAIDSCEGKVTTVKTWEEFLKENYQIYGVG